MDIKNYNNSECSLNKIKNKSIIILNIFGYLYHDSYRFLNIINDSEIVSTRLNSLILNISNENQFDNESNKLIKFFKLSNKIQNICNENYVTQMINQSHKGIKEKLLNIEFLYTLKKIISTVIKDNRNDSIILRKNTEKYVNNFTINYFFHKNKYFKNFELYTNSYENIKNYNSVNTNNNNLTITNNITNEYYISSESKMDIMELVKLLREKLKNLKSFYYFMSCSYEKKFLHTLTFKLNENSKNILYEIMGELNKNPKIKFYLLTDDLQKFNYYKISNSEKENFIKFVFFNCLEIERKYLINKIANENDNLIKTTPIELFLIYLISNSTTENLLNIIVTNNDCFDLTITLNENKNVELNMLNFSGEIKQDIFCELFKNLNVTKSLKVIAKDTMSLETLFLIHNNYIENITLNIKLHQLFNFFIDKFFESFPNLKFIDSYKKIIFKKNNKNIKVIESENFLDKNIDFKFEYFRYYVYKLLPSKQGKNLIMNEKFFVNIENDFSTITEIILDFNNNFYILKNEKSNRKIKDIYSYDINDILNKSTNLQHLTLINLPMNEIKTFFDKNKKFPLIKKLTIENYIYYSGNFQLNKLIPPCFNSIEMLEIIIGQYDKIIKFNIKNLSTNCLYDKILTIYENYQNTGLKSIFFDINKFNEIKNKIIINEKNSKINPNFNNIPKKIKNKIKQKDNNFSEKNIENLYAKNNLEEIILELISSVNGADNFNFGCFYIFVKNDNSKNKKLLLIKQREEINYNLDFNEKLNLLININNFQIEKSILSDLIKLYLKFKDYDILSIKYKNNKTETTENSIILKYDSNILYYYEKYYEISIKNKMQLSVIFAKSILSSIKNKLVIYNIPKFSYFEKLHSNYLNEIGLIYDEENCILFDKYNLSVIKNYNPNLKSFKLIKNNFYIYFTESTGFHALTINNACLKNKSEFFDVTINNFDGTFLNIFNILCNINNFMKLSINFMDFTLQISKKDDNIYNLNYIQGRINEQFKFLLDYFELIDLQNFLVNKQYFLENEIEINNNKYDFFSNENYLNLYLLKNNKEYLYYCANEKIMIKIKIKKINSIYEKNPNNKKCIIYIFNNNISEIEDILKEISINSTFILYENKNKFELYLNELNQEKKISVEIKNNSKMHFFKEKEYLTEEILAIIKIFGCLYKEFYFNSINIKFINEYMINILSLENNFIIEMNYENLIDINFIKIKELINYLININSNSLDNDYIRQLHNKSDILFDNENHISIIFPFFTLITNKNYFINELLSIKECNLFRSKELIISGEIQNYIYDYLMTHENLFIQKLNINFYGKFNFKYSNNNEENIEYFNIEQIIENNKNITEILIINKNKISFGTGEKILFMLKFNPVSSFINFYLKENEISLSNEINNQMLSIYFDPTKTITNEQITGIINNNLNYVKNFNFYFGEITFQQKLSSKIKFNNNFCGPKKQAQIINHLCNEFNINNLSVNNTTITKVEDIINYYLKILSINVECDDDFNYGKILLGDNLDNSIPDLIELYLKTYMEFFIVDLDKIYFKKVPKNLARIVIHCPLSDISASSLEDTLNAIKIETGIQINFNIIK